jgi:hypothetical protein
VQPAGEGRVGRVGDQVAQRAARIIPAEWRLQRQRLASRLNDLPDFVGAQRQPLGDLGDAWLATTLLLQVSTGLVHVANGRDDVAWHADGARLLGRRSPHRLANPPVGVGAEAIPLAPVVLFDRVRQADVALLDEIEQRQASSKVLARDADHQAQVGLGQAASRICVANFDALRELDLLLGGE